MSERMEDGAEAEGSSKEQELKSFVTDRLSAIADPSGAVDRSGSRRGLPS
jgi:hypothetical protein